MKKRILALLLAGLLTTSLISCITTKPRPNDPGLGEGTETNQTINGTDETDPITTITWITVDQNMYVTAASTTLTKVDDNTTTIKVNQLTELHCIKASSDAKRYIVEKDGVQYYAMADKLTGEDLLGKTFTACTPKTMYAKSTVNVRKYASDNSSYSSVIKTLSVNDTVTVVAQGASWSKILYGENTYYFVYSDYLSDSKVADPNNEDYSSYFTDCNPTYKMYVNTTSLNVRKNSNFDADVIANLAMNAEVTVLAEGTIDDTKWYKILVPDDIKEGQTQTYSVGYASARFFSESKGTLDDMLAQYPTFQKKAEPITLYVSSDALFVRSTPSFPEAKDNIVATLQKKNAVKVVATGVAEENNWAMIELDGKYCFVGYSMLTTNENGDPMPLTFEELLAKYSFTACTEKTVYAKGTVQCNTTPSNQATASKTLQSGDAVRILATGTVSYAEWYLFQIEGDSAYYFAGASLFTEAAAAQ